jgi:hypothetical protein
VRRDGLLGQHGAQHGQPDLGHPMRGQRPGLVEGTAGQQLHHDPGPVVLGDHVVHPDDRTVSQPGRHPRLADRAFAQDGAAFGGDPPGQ